MSLENGEKDSVDRSIESNCNANKKSRITYSREFLLSLGGLDVCQKLPSGFDKSLLSEFEDASLERQRGPGSFSSHGFRRNEYGSSPPTRGDSSGYTRGLHGKWDSRSSGRSDKDSEQSDADSDTGRRPAYQPRRGWQPPEHDGLLGSGSFPRPSGYGPGAAKFRPNDHYQLNRSSEPYHPPRTYKAIPHARRETNDSYNDETFGSSECTSEDKAEEERKRRASFELMRKEQQKAFQERQRMNVDKQKDEFDIMTLLDDPGDEKKPVKEAKESNEAALTQTPNGDSSKPSFTHQIMGPRPLVPPGFAGAVPDKKSQSAEVKASTPEVSKSFARDSNSLNNSSSTLVEKHSADQADSIVKQHKSTTIQNLVIDDNEKIKDSTLDISSKSIGEKNIIAAFDRPETLESSDISEIVKFDFEKAGNNTVGPGSQSTTILEKLFGNALTSEATDSSSSIEQKDGKGGDAWSPHSRTQSSKFAQWFVEDNKHSDNLVPGRSKDILSLIVAGEKNESSTFDMQPSEQPWPDSLFSVTQSADGQITSDVTPTTDKKPEHLFSNSKSEAVPTVLTCEDLENSILSEFSESGSNTQPSPLDWGANGAVAEQPRADVDDHASHQLLSLLQKGHGQKDAGLFSNLDVKISGKPYNTDFEETGITMSNSDVNKETAAHTARSLTLETLFGTAFMQELQSVGAPVSAQRNLGGSARIETIEPHGSSLPFLDESVLSSRGCEVISGRTGHEGLAFSSNHGLHSSLDKIDGHFLGIDVTQNQADAAQLKPEERSKLVDLNRPADIWLPEEDSLIAAGDPLNSQGYLPGQGPINKAELFTSQNNPTAPVNIVDKLTVLNGLFKEENLARGGHPPFHQVSFDKRDSDVPLQNLHIQSSSPQLHPHQLNQMGPLFHPLDSYPGQNNPQMKLVPAEGILHHDRPPSHQFPLDMVHPPVHHPSTGFTGFDPPNHHPLFQQLHMSGNLPPPQQFQGFPRGSQIPHPNKQMPGFVQDPNAMQGFLFGPRQPNFSGLAMPPTASEIGGGNNGAEALQKLIEMELRPNAKQMHPFPPVGHSQGVFGHELDMGFRYR